MQLEKDIEEALRDTFISAFPGEVENTAFENVVFDTAGKAAWFQLHYLPNSPQPATLGTAGTDEVTGIFQIDYSVREGKGQSGLADVVQRLRDVYTPSQHIIFNTADVSIRSCGRVPGAGRQNPGFFTFAISISWEARINR